MSKLRVPCFSLSLDGFAAGPEQSLENPNGIGGLDIHDWFFPTATRQLTLSLERPEYRDNAAQQQHAADGAVRGR